MTVSFIEGLKLQPFNPWGSMYGILTYVWLISMVNVGIYTIHGSSGNEKHRLFPNTNPVFFVERLPGRWMWFFHQHRPPGIHLWIPKPVVDHLAQGLFRGWKKWWLGKKNGKHIPQWVLALWVWVIYTESINITQHIPASVDSVYGSGLELSICCYSWILNIDAASSAGGGSVQIRKLTGEVGCELRMVWVKVIIYAFYHGESPFFTTIWCRFLSFFPTTEEANLSRGYWNATHQLLSPYTTSTCIFHLFFISIRFMVWL